MVATNTSFRSYKYTQTTDGVNDYYSGIDGTNGFSIAAFAGKTGMTFSILIDLPTQIDSTSAQRRLLEIADASRTNLMADDLGAFSGLLTNEYIGSALVTGTTKVFGRTSAVETISAGWHHIVLATGDSGVTVTCIDGVQLNGSVGAFGAPLTATSTFTANKIGLMASSAGGVPTACTWREALLVNIAWPIANMQKLYNFYTRDGNVSIEKSDRSAWRFLGTPISRPEIAGLWKGDESGTDLLESVNNSARRLVKTNF